MEKHLQRQMILQAVADRAPAPTTIADLMRHPDIAMLRLTETAVAGELAELESRGYIANINNRLNPVYNGLTGAGRDQLDGVGKLDPAIWGNAAL